MKLQLLQWYKVNSIFQSKLKPVLFTLTLYDQRKTMFGSWTCKIQVQIPAQP